MKMRKYFPDLLTGTSLACGLAAVLTAVEGNWGFALGLVFLSVIMDGLDGKVARYLQVSNPHGELIDSLADICSFGFAPAVLFYLTFDRPMIWSLIWLGAIAFRLIRFNYVKRLEKVDSFGRIYTFEVGLASPWSALLLLLPVALSHGLGIAPDFIQKGSPVWLVLVAAMAVAPWPVAIPLRFGSKWATRLFGSVSAFSTLLAALIWSPWHAYVVLTAWIIVVIPMSALTFLYLPKKMPVHV